MKKIGFLLLFMTVLKSGCSHVQEFAENNRAHKVSKKQIKMICSIYNRESTPEIRHAYRDLANCTDHMEYIKRNEEKEHFHLYNALMQSLKPPFRSDQHEKLYNAIEETYDPETESFSLDSDLEDVYDEIYDDLCDECSFRSDEEKAASMNRGATYHPSDRPLGGHPYVSHHKGTCNLKNYKLKKPLLQSCQLPGGNFFAADFGEVHLEGSNLKGANLQNAHLEKAFLVDAHLEDANAHGANFNGADLSRANLVRVNLQYVKMIETRLQQSNLSLADLTHARLDKVQARKASFKGAKLVSAKLRHSNFEKVNFVGADLSGADIEGSSFKDADLSKAKLNKVQGMVESCPDEMPDDYECDKDKKNSFVKDDSFF